MHLLFTTGHSKNVLLFIMIRIQKNKPPSINPMWLVSSMIISIIKFRFHVQSAAQLNYLLSSIVYVPDSKFTYNVANAL